VETRTQDKPLFATYADRIRLFRVLSLIVSFFIFLVASSRISFVLYLLFLGVLTASTVVQSSKPAFPAPLSRVFLDLALSVVAALATGGPVSPFVFYLAAALVALPLTARPAITATFMFLGASVLLVPGAFRQESLPALSATLAASLALAALGSTMAGLFRRTPGGIAGAHPTPPSSEHPYKQAADTVSAAVKGAETSQAAAPETAASAESQAPETTAQTAEKAETEHQTETERPPVPAPAPSTGASLPPDWHLRTLQEAIDLHRTFQSHYDLSQLYESFLRFIARLGFHPEALVVFKKSENGFRIELAGDGVSVHDVTPQLQAFFEPPLKLPDQLSIENNGATHQYSRLTELPELAIYIPETYVDVEPATFGLLRLTGDLFCYRASEQVLSEKERVLFSRFSSLYTVARAFSDTFDIRTMLESTAEAVKGLTGMEKAVAMLMDESGRFDLDSERAVVKGRKIEHPEEIWRAALLKAAQEASSFSKPVVATLAGGESTLLCVPVSFGTTTYGVIAGLTSNTRDEALADVKTLEVIAALAGISLSNLELMRAREQIAVTTERDRIARDMHDSLVQSLFSLLLQVETTIQSARKDPQRAVDKLQKVKEGIQSTIKEVREYIYELYPQALTDIGLKAAIKRVVSALNESAGSIYLQIGKLPDSIPLPLENAALKVVQEAVSNAVRHSGASTINVEVDLIDNSLRVLVEDNGSGFVPSDVTSSIRAGEKLGLRSMNERVRQLGGKLRIASSPGKGTRVEALIPVDLDTEEEAE
jgi:signal transduction histidine kinase